MITYLRCFANFPHDLNPIEMHLESGEATFNGCEVIVVEDQRHQAGDFPVDLFGLVEACSYTQLPLCLRPSSRLQGHVAIIPDSGRVQIEII